MTAVAFRSGTSNSAEANASQQRANSKRDSARLNRGVSGHHRPRSVSTAAGSVIEEGSECVAPFFSKAGEEVIEGFARSKGRCCSARGHQQKFELRPQSLVFGLFALSERLVNLPVEGV